MEPKKPKPKAKRVQRSNIDKHEIFHLKRLVVLQKLWDDTSLNQKLEIPQVKHEIVVPRRVDGKFDIALEKLLVKERGIWVQHVNQNPRNRMTVARAHDIIEKAV